MTRILSLYRRIYSVKSPPVFFRVFSFLNVRRQQMSVTSKSSGIVDAEGGFSSHEAGFTAFDPQKTTHEELLKVLEENRSLDMVYGGFKANHNIHALCSLYGLGGI